MSDSVQQKLQALYAGCGYQPFRVKKFERYELYSENRRFLTSHYSRTGASSVATIFLRSFPWHRRVDLHSTLNS